MNEQDALGSQVAEAGFDFINDTNEHDGNWFCIIPISGAATIKARAELDPTTQTGVGDDFGAGGAYSGAVISQAQDVPLYGRFDKITLGAGTVLAYRIKQDDN